MTRCGVLRREATEAVVIVSHRCVHDFGCRAFGRVDVVGGLADKTR